MSLQWIRRQSSSSSSSSSSRARRHNISPARLTAQCRHYCSLATSGTPYHSCLTGIACSPRLAGFAFRPQTRSCPSLATTPSIAPVLEAAPYEPARTYLRGLVDVYQAAPPERPAESRGHAREPWSGYTPDPQADEAKSGAQPSLRLYFYRSGPPLPPCVSPLVQRLTSLLHHGAASPEAIFDAYNSLPGPRMANLDRKHIKQLLYLFRQVEDKSEEGMVRYFTLLDDMNEVGIPLSSTDWNSAMSFAARWMKPRVGVDQVDATMHIFFRMERETGDWMSETTFNILFDMATKAGRFGLAEVILDEMDKRQLSHSRHLHSAKIFHHGIRRDGQAVRKCYQDMIDAGELIDTAVLNCVIVSLIRAGEAAAAECVFDKMKQMATACPVKMPVPWRDRRQLGVRLAAIRLGSIPQRREPAQRMVPVLPDLHTYRALIRYHSRESANIDRIMELIGEMPSLGLYRHGSLFWHIFTGFWRHGGIRYSAWTKGRLDKMWQLFLTELDKEPEHGDRPAHQASKDERACHLTLGMVLAVLRAYGQCADMNVVWRVQQDILERWQPTDEDSERFHTMMAGLEAEQRKKSWSVFS